eukprot:3889397-Prymnesium_polylepis.1
MAFAFVKGEHPDFEWDVELSLLGCGLPLPDLIEDKMLSSLTERVRWPLSGGTRTHIRARRVNKRSQSKFARDVCPQILGMFDNANPITIVLSDADVTEEEKEEGKEVTVRPALLRCESEGCAAAGVLWTDAGGATAGEGGGAAAARCPRRSSCLSQPGGGGELSVAPRSRWSTVRFAITPHSALRFYRFARAQGTCSARHVFDSLDCTGWG